MSPQDADKIDWNAVRAAIETQAAKFHAMTGFDVQACEGACWLAVAKAYRLYDPSKGVAFTTYAYPGMIRYMRAEYRRLGRVVTLPRDLLQYDAINTDLEHIAELPAPDEARPYDADEIALVKELVAKLPRKEREAINAYYIEGKFFHEIAAEMGIHHNTPSQRCQRALAKLRQEAVILLNRPLAEKSAKEKMDETSPAVQ